MDEWTPEQSSLKETSADALADGNETKTTEKKARLKAKRREAYLAAKMRFESSEFGKELKSRRKQQRQEAYRAAKEKWRERQTRSSETASKKPQQIELKLTLQKEKDSPRPPGPPDLRLIVNPDID